MLHHEIPNKDQDENAIKNSSEEENKNLIEKKPSSLTLYDIPNDLIYAHILTPLEFEDIDALFKVNKIFSSLISQSPYKYEVHINFPYRTDIQYETYANLPALKQKIESNLQQIIETNEEKIHSLTLKQRSYQCATTFFPSFSCLDSRSETHTGLGDHIKKSDECAMMVSVFPGLAMWGSSAFTQIFGTFAGICGCPGICAISGVIGLATCACSTCAAKATVSVSQSCYSFFNDKLTAIEQEKKQLKKEIYHATPMSMCMNK